MYCKALAKRPFHGLQTTPDPNRTIRTQGTVSVGKVGASMDTDLSRWMRPMSLRLCFEGLHSAESLRMLGGFKTICCEIQR